MSVRYRVTAAPQASGYSEAGASYKRRALRAFFPNSSSPSSDIHDNADTLRQRSRMLYMSAPIATSAINTNRTKVVGTGLNLKATIDRDVLGLSPEAAKEWQTKTEAEFRLWAENRRSCDAMGLNNFYGLQQLTLKSWLMSGDVFAGQAASLWPAAASGGGRPSVHPGQVRRSAGWSGLHRGQEPRQRKQNL